MKKYAFLAADPRHLTPEERAARQFCRTRFGRTLTVVGLRNLPSLLDAGSSPAVLWWHYDASTDLPPLARDPGVIAALLSYLERGGGLLLSLLAARYATDLGIETIPPNVIVKGVWDEECWAPGTQDIRGMATPHGHPLFDGLGKGAYTWSPARGDPFAAAWYDHGSLPASGLVAGVERQYIGIDDRRRIAIEYRMGKGRVLTIGSHFFFAHANPRFRLHLERLASNGLAYLSSRTRPARGTHWSFAQKPPEEIARSSPPLQKSDPVPSGNVLPPGIRRRPATSNEFDTGGRRILILGEESRGIDEVWVHPHRILNEFRTTFSVGAGKRQGAGLVPDDVTLRHGLVVRNFRCDGALIEESIFGDRVLPAGAVRYRIESTLPVVIAIAVRVDLRAMWPLPASATGALHYGWDEGLQALSVSNGDGRGGSLIGSGKRPDARRMEAVGGEHREIVLALEYTFHPGDAPLTIAFAGSAHREATAAYRRMVKSTDRRLALQTRHSSRIIEGAAVIEGPDAQFNEGYRTALVSTERFSVEVPGLGPSLMAGYASTAHGWNGGHAVSGRPGYAWFFGRDSVWTSFAMLGCGMHDTVRDVLAFLGDHQDLTGKILHEMTTSGFTHYDAADATPLYIILMGRYLTATGDVRFVRSQKERFRRAFAYCLSTDTDGDHLIENTNVGHGWIEGGPLYPVHTELYLAACWGEALAQAAAVARRMGDARLARKCGKEARVVGNSIRKLFWNPGTRVYSFGKNADGSYRSGETALQAVAMLFGLTDRKNDAHVLDRLASDQFSADWGIRMVPRESPHYDPAGYHEGSIWPLCTGWTSLAEFLNRRPVQGFIHAMGNLQLGWHWSAGNFPEVLHGERCAPAGVCAHQAWSGSMVLQPLIEGMLGFRADASGRRVSLRPYFPPEWERAEARRLRIGKDSITMTMRRRMNRTSFIFSATTARPIEVEFCPWFPCGTTLHAIRAGSIIAVHDIHVSDPDDVPPLPFTLKGELRVTYEHTGGVAVVPPVAPLIPGEASSGLRFIRDRWEKGVYEIVVEGMRGREYMLDLVAAVPPREIEHARILRQEADRVTLGIRFDGQDGGAGYERKSVRTVWEF